MTRSTGPIQSAPRTIIVGAGLMGRHHARAAVLAGASIVAVVDSDREAGHALASRFPGAQSFGDLEGLLRTVDADAAHICTPADTHLELGETVANLGLHALVEKPFATNAAETKRLLEKFDKAGLIACPVHQYAFQRSLRSTIEALPRLGSLRQIAFDICSAGATRSGMDLDELVREILPHPLAMLQKLVPGAKIGELNWSCIRAAPGEWLIGARLDGTIVSIAMSMSGRPTRFLTRITADHGTTELDNFHDFAVSWPGQVSRIQKIASPFIRGSLVLAGASLNLMGRAARREFAYPGLGMLAREFYGAIRNPAACQAPISAEEAIAVAEARDRISRLAMNG